MKQKIFKIHNKFCIVLFVFFKEFEKKTLTLTKFTMKKKLPVQTAPKNTRNGQTIFFSQFFVQFWPTLKALSQKNILRRIFMIMSNFELIY